MVVALNYIRSVDMCVTYQVHIFTEGIDKNQSGRQDFLHSLHEYINQKNTHYTKNWIK